MTTVVGTGIGNTITVTEQLIQSKKRVQMTRFFSPQSRKFSRPCVLLAAPPPVQEHRRRP
jgi:hypothetical protein